MRKSFFLLIVFAFAIFAAMPLSASPPGNTLPISLSVAGYQMTGYTLPSVAVPEAQVSVAIQSDSVPIRNGLLGLVAISASALLLLPMYRESRLWPLARDQTSFQPSS